MWEEMFHIGERRRNYKTQTKEEFEEAVADWKRDCRQVRKDDEHDRTVPSDREIEVEFALCQDMPYLLSLVLKEEGSIRGGLRLLNRGLEEAPHYDDEYGTVSTETFYQWVEKYADADDTRESTRKTLQRFSR